MLYAHKSNKKYTHWDNTEANQRRRNRIYRYSTFYHFQINIDLSLYMTVAELNANARAANTQLLFVYRIHLMYHIWFVVWLYLCSICKSACVSMFSMICELTELWYTRSFAICMSFMWFSGCARLQTRRLYTTRIIVILDPLRLHPPTGEMVESYGWKLSGWNKMPG